MRTGSPVRLQPPAPLETAPARSGAVSDGPPRQRSGAPPSHLQPVEQGPAFRLARKGLPHGRSRQSSEGPQRSGGPAKRVDGRDRPVRGKRAPSVARALSRRPADRLQPTHTSFRRTSILPTDSAEDPRMISSRTVGRRRRRSRSCRTSNVVWRNAGWRSIRRRRTSSTARMTTGRGSIPRSSSPSWGTRFARVGRRIGGVSTSSTSRRR